MFIRSRKLMPGAGVLISIWRSFYRASKQAASYPILPDDETAMRRGVLRLAETSPHLLEDIGFERPAKSGRSSTVTWRARQLPSVSLTETAEPSIWSLTCGRG